MIICCYGLVGFLGFGSTRVANIQILPYFFSGNYHVAQCSNSLRPGSSFETTVRVHKCLLEIQHGQETSQLRFNLFGGWNDRGVNIIQSRTKTFGISNTFESTKGSVVASGILNGIHIRVHAINGYGEDSGIKYWRERGKVTLEK